MAKNTTDTTNIATPTVNGTFATADKVNMSVGNITRDAQPGTKTSGVKMRGAGAATKGTMCRGPMG
jgi:hypothetical protein